MGKLIKTTSILLVFVHFCVYAVSRPATIKRPYDYKKEIAKKEKLLDQMTKKLSDLEKKMSDANRDYIELIIEKDNLEDSLKNAANDLTKEKKKITLKIQELKKNAARIIVRLVEEEESDVSLLEEKILLEKLSEKKKKYEKILKNMKRLEGDNERNRKALSKVIINADNLLQQVLSMEEQKRKSVSKYMKVANQKDKLKNKYNKSKLAKYVTRSSTKKVKKSKLLMSPISDYVDLEYQKKKKGITFSFKKIMPVNAPRSGQVIYKGTLASYGDIVIMNHDKHLKTVILGSYSPMVKKNVILKKGDIIGYTRIPRGRLEGKLYFELRKNDKPQNTILWVENIRSINEKGRKRI